MKKQNIISLIFCVFSMLLLVADTKTALSAAVDGLQVCLNVVVPSLFPFFFLSAIINNALMGFKIPMTGVIGKLCKIPRGAESLMLVGLIGGYPVGAASIGNAYRKGHIDKSQAERMLGFCNNAGPAFLFGMMSQLFDVPAACWLLWLAHILSALVTGMLLPSSGSTDCKVPEAKAVSPTEALALAIRNTANVCGWIILFRVIMGFCDRWFLWFLPNVFRLLIYGFLELSNGCLSLTAIPQAGLRFILASIFLAWGGLCVMLQTSSVASGLSLRSYFTGKACQTAISMLISYIIQFFLFKEEAIILPGYILLTCIFVIFLPILKKAVDFRKIIGYNRRIIYDKRCRYAVSKENAT